MADTFKGGVHGLQSNNFMLEKRTQVQGYSYTYQLDHVARVDQEDVQHDGGFILRMLQTLTATNLLKGTNS